MGMPGLPELTIILVIVILLFGAKKIPELAKGLGSGIKNFKDSMKDDEDETQKVATQEPKKIDQNEQQTQQTSTTDTTTKA